MRKFIVIHGNEAMEPILRESLPTTQEYCERHGYALIVDRETKLIDRPVFYEKQRAAHSAMLQSGEDSFGVFLDADATVNPKAPCFMDVLNGRDLAMRVIKPHVINAGVMMFKNSPLMRQFFKHVYEHGKVSNEEWQYILKEKYGIDEIPGCDWDERTMMYLRPQYDLSYADLPAVYNSFHPMHENMIFHAGLRKIHEKVSLLKVQRRLWEVQ